jgi:hypothetical protein
MFLNPHRPRIDFTRSRNVQVIASGGFIRAVSVTLPARKILIPFILLLAAQLAVAF